jgi:hypothetical protein
MSVVVVQHVPGEAPCAIASAAVDAGRCCSPRATATPSRHSGERQRMGPAIPPGGRQPAVDAFMTAFPEEAASAPGLQHDTPEGLAALAPYRDRVLGRLVRDTEAHFLALAVLAR